MSPTLPDESGLFRFAGPCMTLDLVVPYFYLFVCLFPSIYDTEKLI